MKFELERLQRGLSEREIIDEIIRVSALIQEPFITAKKFDEFSKISASQLRKRYGGWEAVLNKCGLGHRYSGKTVSYKMTKQVAKNLSNEELIHELRRVAKSLRKSELSQSDFDSNSAFSSSAITRRFGSWYQGLAAAELETVKMAKRYTEIEYYENLLEVWTHYGRQPKYAEMNSTPSKISSGAYERKWGKWSNALLSFIAYANGDIVMNEEPVEPKIVIRDISVDKKKEKRGISLGMRYAVLSRDRFRCIKCGLSPATSLDCKLHVDHITPFSKEGKTTIENLQTTCESCNLGKGNRYNE